MCGGRLRLMNRNSGMGRADHAGNPLRRVIDGVKQTPTVRTDSKRPRSLLADVADAIERRSGWLKPRILKVRGVGVARDRSQVDQP